MSKLKSNIERLFGYRHDPIQCPKDLQQAVLDELWPEHLALGIRGVGSEAIVLKTNAWEDEKKKRRINYAIKIAADEFVAKTYDRVNFYSARVEKPNQDRNRFVNGIKIQKSVYNLPKTPFSLVIPKVLEVKEEPWLSFVMEFVDGLPLIQFLEETKDFRTSMSLYMTLLKGVEELHRCKVIHRDIKPENILVCGNRMLVPQLCLLDWTSSKMLGVEWANTLAGTAIGTLPYASDKLTIEGNAKEASEADDVEPLAVMIYEFSNFQKIPKPDCDPALIASDRNTKRRYRNLVRESIPEPLRRVYDCGGETKFREVGQLIVELEKSFLEMDFDLAPAPKTVIEDSALAAIRARVDSLDGRMGRIEKFLEEMARIFGGF